MTDAIPTQPRPRMLRYPAEAPMLRAPDDALELVGSASAARASVVALPVARLDPRFFQLANGFAGDFLQKLVNYGLRLIVVGDISDRLAESKALRDFVRESNRGRQIRFVRELAEVADDYDPV
jgi:hypothetical protein